MGGERRGVSPPCVRKSTAGLRLRRSPPRWFLRLSRFTQKPPATAESWYGLCICDQPLSGEVVRGMCPACPCFFEALQSGGCTWLAARVDSWSGFRLSIRRPTWAAWAAPAGTARIHTPGGSTPLGEEHVRSVAGLRRLASATLSRRCGWICARTRLYQDGLPVCGHEGEIVRDTRRRQAAVTTSSFAS